MPRHVPMVEAGMASGMTGSMPEWTRVAVVRGDTNLGGGMSEGPPSAPAMWWGLVWWRTVQTLAEDGKVDAPDLGKT